MVKANSLPAKIVKALFFIVCIPLLWAGKPPLAVTPAQAYGAVEGNPIWWLESARFAYQQGDLMGALQILKESRKRFPGRLTREIGELEASILYDLGKPEETVKILAPLSISYALSNESLLVLARAYKDLKGFGKALFYARLVEKKAAQTELVCQAKIIEAEVYLLSRVKRKALQKAQEVLASPCNLQAKAQALEIILKSGYSLKEIEALLNKNPVLRVYVPEFYKRLGDQLLQKGEIEKAEKAYFRYFNLGGREEEMPALLFQLAEAYFHQNRLRKARIYYELLLTAWPHFDESKFAKFRVYHLDYIFHKRLGLPTLKERKVLIPLINELRKKYPRRTITQEARALQVRLYLEDKKPEEAFFTAIDFLKNYPQSSLIEEIYGLLCEADSLYLQMLLGEKKGDEILALDRKYRLYLKTAQCGPHFYWLGKFFEKYHLESLATYHFLRAYEFGISRGWEPELLLNLAEKALSHDQNKLEVAAAILDLAVKKYPYLSQNPSYLFLKGALSSQKGDWTTARSLFEQILSQKKIPPEIQEKVLRAFFSLAIKSKDVDLAFNILKDPRFSSGENEFAFIIQIALENEDYLRAQKILAFAEKRFPDSLTLKWIKGLLLERLGKEKKALAVWRELSDSQTSEGKLAQGILKSLELVEKAREVIF